MVTALLDGTTVIEVAHPHTEYAGLLLAGLGAEVILVEPVEGSLTRQRRPFLSAGDGTRHSIPFLARNLSKKSITVDPTDPDSIRRLEGLLAGAHGVLEASSSPLAPLFHDLDPQLPRVTISDDLGLGISSIVAFARSGGLSSSGWPHQPPCNAPSWLAFDGAGIYAAVMLLASIRAGTTQSWSVPLHEAALAAITPWTRPLHSYQMTAAGQGAVSARMGPGAYPFFRCRDGGFIRILTATPKQWRAWFELLGRPEDLSGPEWEAAAFRSENQDLVAAIAQDIVAQHTVDELFKRGQQLGLTITPVLSLGGVFEDPHMGSRKLFQSLDDPDAGKVKVVRPTVQFPDEGDGVQWQPAPSLGQHDTQLRTPRRDAQGQRSRVVPAHALPLAGIRVLHFGVGAVVPEAASLLALLGADVVKIESHTHIDFLRQLGLRGPQDNDSAPTFNQMNLGVRSVALDMTTEHARQAVRKMVPSCDIVMENLRGPVMKNWGLDYNSVAALRPDVIYLSSQGLGDGPYGGFQTYGPNLQTVSGVTSIWAHPDDPFPVGSTLNHPDHTAGKQFLTAVLAALIRRDRTGKGCFLDCAQFESAVAMIGDRFLEYQLWPDSGTPRGNSSPDMVPHGCYPCSGDDRWIALAVEDDEQWSRLALLLSIRDESLSTFQSRLERRPEIDSKVAQWTRQSTPEDVESILRAARIPVSRVLTGDDFARDEGAHSDGLFACLSHPTAGTRWYTGLPILDADGNRVPVRRSPLLGEHDLYGLYELAGLTFSDVNTLFATGSAGI